MKRKQTNPTLQLIQKFDQELKKLLLTDLNKAKATPQLYNMQKGAA